MDWTPIEHKLDQAYPKSMEHMGRKVHHPLVLFSMSLLQTWYGLSDQQVEQQVNDKISFMDFCGINFTISAPDSTVLCRFRKELTECGTYDKLLVEITRQLPENEIIVKKGISTDASNTPQTQRKKDLSLARRRGYFSFKRSKKKE
mgnify:CR=1 FL=1